ncbi:MAG: aspartate aminotransferase family protein [Actinobacteria bacterium 13_1_40CM_2_65_8]|nr:MAG: aspartate aminotransferase family protein [Actinobacteria bacterium 13_1_40CM_2_65_8]
MGHDLTTTHTQLSPIPLHAGRGLTLVRGEGSYLWDDKDRRYLDLMTNYGVNLLGHTHPLVTDAIKLQASRLTNAHQSFDTPARQDFLDALGSLLPPPLSRISFGNSGAEAIEAALKFARVATGRIGVIATHRAYHGRTFGALSATADAKYRDPFAPMLEGVRHVPFDDLDAVDGVLDDSVAAVIVEPIQGEGGVRVPADGYLRGIRERCDARGILLICDEIQTGFRTGSPFAFTREDIVPDILCLSKSIANGLPIGVTVTTEAVSERVPKGSHGSTFAGNPLVCAAGAATLRVLGDGELHARAAQAGARFQQKIRDLRLPQIREVRGRGLMLAVELKKPATPVIKAMQERGVLVLPGGGTVIRFLPSILIQDDQLDEGIAVLGEALRKAG